MRSKRNRRGDTDTVGGGQQGRKQSLGVDAPAHCAVALTGWKFKSRICLTLAVCASANHSVLPFPLTNGDSLSDDFSEGH